jgi:hypothetical protein
MMSGRILTLNSILLCPHGAPVRGVPASTAVVGDAAPLANTDSFSISGCPFQLPTAPSPTPSPCITVQWLPGPPGPGPQGKALLTESSIGLCIGATGMVQGVVQVAATQPLVITG